MINTDSLDEAVFKRLEESYRKNLESAVISPIIANLEKDLPDTLFYHTIVHTKDVLCESLKFGILGGLSDRQLELLAIAAAYHDSGYLVRMEDNEIIGAESAENAMREAGTYSDAEIKLVSDMIIDTKLNDLGSLFVRTISSELAEYLLDADLSNLGREDFFKKGELLKKELNLSPEVFHTLTLKLIENHEWQTTAAEKLRGKQAIRNFELFKEMVK